MSDTTMTDLKACREAFEVHMKDMGYLSFSRLTPESDKYERGSVEYAWSIWKAAWNTRAPRAAPADDVEGK